MYTVGIVVRMMSSSPCGVNADRSTRGDASIGTIAVVDTCGYTPPHTPSKAVLGVVRGRWSVAGSAERDGDAGGHGVRQHICHVARLVRLIQLG